MANANPNVVPMTPTISHLIYATGAVRSAIERQDKFRHSTAEKFGDIKMNNVTELSMSEHWGFLRDAYDGIKAHPGLQHEVSERENQELFDLLRESQRKLPWADGGWWRVLCLYAKLMNLTGYEEAEAQQPRGGEHG